MFESRSDSQAAPCAIVAIGDFAGRIADELVQLVPAGELRILEPESASTSGVDANVTFVIWNAQDLEAGGLAAGVEQRVRATGALAAGMRVFSSARAEVTLVPASPVRSGLRIELGRDGIEHTIACLIGGFAGAMGERAAIAVDLADVRAALEHPDNATLIGVGYGAGAMRATKATYRALHELGMTDDNLRGANGIFVLIAGASLKLTELRDVTNVMRTLAGAQTHVYPGAYREERLGRLCRVTLVVSVPTDAR